MDNLKGIFRVFKKEFRSYFVSPIAYIVISLFLGVTGWLFFNTFFAANQATLRSFFNLLPALFLIIIPAVTMHLFAEEVSVGSYELLLTMPLNLMDIIVGKYLAAIALCGVALIPTLSYPLCASVVGSLDTGPIIGGYLGAVLLIGAYGAIGVFASSLSKSQIISFIISVGICGILWLIEGALRFLNTQIALIQYFSTVYHFENIAKGVLDLRDIFYFLTIIFIAMYGTKLVMEEKK